jgi:hypothetical protein
MYVGNNTKISFPDTTHLFNLYTTFIYDAENTVGTCFSNRFLSVIFTHDQMHLSFHNKTTVEHDSKSHQ